MIFLFNYLLTRIERRIESADQLARERADEIRHLLDSAGEGFYGIDVEGRCTFINQACLDMFGFSSENELLGRHMHGIVHHTRADGLTNPESRCHIHGMSRSESGPHVGEDLFWRADGSSFPAQYSANPLLRDGRIVGAVVSIMDVTERQETVSRLHRNLIDQEIIASILRLSQSVTSLDEILQKTLELVLTSNDLGLQTRGCIFLMDGGRLKMVAQQGLHDHLLSACADIALGYCLCGRAAETRALVYADGVDHRHEVTFPGMNPHGHYCMPIQTEEELLGILNLYVPAGHAGSEDELRFIGIVANTLAGVITRGRLEEKERNNRLALQAEIVERKRAESIMEAMALAARQLLETADWRDCVHTVFDALGRALEIHHIRFFTVSQNEGGLALDLFHEWGTTGAVGQDERAAPVPGGGWLERQAVRSRGGGHPRMGGSGTFRRTSGSSCPARTWSRSSPCR
ncbi:MAG: PAS domain S-box protein [Alphaproteobacteria bacterium]